jgi:hypothetical protein
MGMNHEDYLSIAKVIAHENKRAGGDSSARKHAKRQALWSVASGMARVLPFHGGQFDCSEFMAACGFGVKPKSTQGMRKGDSYLWFGDHVKVVEIIDRRTVSVHFDRHDAEGSRYRVSVLELDYH